MENQETPKINITPKPEKIFREKTDKTLDKSVFSYSEEQENTEWPYGEKQLLLLDENKNRIGQIQFNYPETEETEKLFKTRIVIINDEYKNKDLGITLYKKLIDLAKEKGFDGIKSDNSVVGGAIATWKKLADEGYQIKVNPKIKEKYEVFLKTYNEGKFFKEGLEVPKEESVFELILENEQTKILKKILEEAEKIEIRPEDRNADGELLVSVNGQKSNLNEQNWKIARTESFRKWFGDWEKYNDFKTTKIKLIKEPFGNSIINCRILDKEKNDVGYTQLLVSKKDKKIYVGGVELKIQGQGFGKDLYKTIARDYPDYELVSDPSALSDSAEKMWDSLVKNGYAQKNNDKEYVFVRPETSKIVDENGEPLFAYHETNKDFEHFDDSKVGSSNDEGYYGVGHYFSFDAGIPGFYAGKKFVAMRGFLNIKHPYYYNDQVAEISFHKYLLNRKPKEEAIKKATEYINITAEKEKLEELESGIIKKHNDIRKDVNFEEYWEQERLRQIEYYKKIIPIHEKTIEDLPKTYDELNQKYDGVITEQEGFVLQKDRYTEVVAFRADQILITKKENKS